MVGGGEQAERTEFSRGAKHARRWHLASEVVSVAAGGLAVLVLAYGFVMFEPNRPDAYWPFVQALFLGLAAIVALVQYRSASSRRRVVFTVEYLRRFDHDYFEYYTSCTLPTLEPADARARVTREYVEEHRRIRYIARMTSDETWPIYPVHSIQLAFLRWHNFCVHVKMWIDAGVLDRATMMKHMGPVFIRTEYVLRDVLRIYEQDTGNEPTSLRTLCRDWARSAKLSEKLTSLFPLDDPTEAVPQEEVTLSTVSASSTAASPGSNSPFASEALRSTH